MAAPVVQSVEHAQQDSPGSDTFTLTKPTGTAEGDLLVALISLTASTITHPTGWTEVRVDDGYGSTDKVRIAYKVAGGSEPASYQWDDGGASGTPKWVGAIYRITGHDPDVPIDVHSGQRLTSGTAVTAPGVTTTVDDCLLLFHGYVGFTSGDRTFTPPGGMTEDYDRSVSTFIAATGAQEDLGAAGATGDRTATASSSANYRTGQLVAIAPPTEKTATDTGAASEDDVSRELAATDSGTSSESGALENTAPNAPTLVSPADDATIQSGDANAFDWTFSDPDAGDTQSAWALRRRRVVLYDDMETWEGWTDVLSGSVSQSSAHAYNGTYSAHKTSNNHGSGAYKEFGEELGNGWKMEARLYSPTPRSGGGANRIVIEKDPNDGNGADGYMASVWHDSTTVRLERSNNESGVTTLSGNTGTNAPENAWYRVTLERDGNDLTMEVFNASDTLLRTLTATDSTYSAFDRIAIKGGYAYHVDDLTVWGPYEWWDATAEQWVATETWNDGTTDGYTFPASAWDAADYLWTVATKDDAGAAGPYATQRELTVIAAVEKTGTDAGAGSDASALAADMSAVQLGSGSSSSTLAADATASDTGAATDAASLATDDSVTDSGSGLDTAELAAELAGVQTATGADASALTADDTASDASAGSDAASVAAELDALDTASGSDSSALAAELVVTDASAGAETAATSASADATDTATGSDTASVAVSRPASDSGAGSEAAQLTAALSATETGSGDAAAVLSASFTSQDAGAGSDASELPAVELTASDSGASSETASTDTALDVTASDSGSGADSSSATMALVASDTGSAAATAAHEAALAAVETATGSDGAALLAAARSVVDAGSGDDLSSPVAALLAVADAGSGTFGSIVVKPALRRIEYGAGLRVSGSDGAVVTFEGDASARPADVRDGRSTVEAQSSSTTMEAR